jgi:hypothetical protein
MSQKVYSIKARYSMSQGIVGNFSNVPGTVHKPGTEAVKAWQGRHRKHRAAAGRMKAHIAQEEGIQQQVSCQAEGCSM